MCCSRSNMQFAKLRGVIEFIDPATLKKHSVRLQQSHSKYAVTLHGISSRSICTYRNGAHFDVHPGERA
jgi:hypothetical protein